MPSEQNIPVKQDMFSKTLKSPSYGWGKKDLELNWFSKRCYNYCSEASTRQLGSSIIALNCFWLVKTYLPFWQLGASFIAPNEDNLPIKQ